METAIWQISCASVADGTVKAEHPNETGDRKIRRKLGKTILSRFILVLVLPILMVVLSTAEPVEAG